MRQFKVRCDLVCHPDWLDLCKIDYYHSELKAFIYSANSLYGNRTYKEEVNISDLRQPTSEELLQKKNLKYSSDL